MGYIKVEWPWSQEWLEFVEYDEDADECISEIEEGEDCSVFVPEEIYEMGADAYRATLQEE